MTRPYLSKDLTAIVLAAGNGDRMKSQTPKPNILNAPSFFVICYKNIVKYNNITVKLNREMIA